jgi:hypothetical protein
MASNPRCRPAIVLHALVFAAAMHVPAARAQPGFAAAHAAGESAEPPARGGAASRDCNANGVPDICDVPPGCPELVTARTLAAGLYPSDVLASDLDLDGTIDLVSANGGDDTLSVFLGAGDGSYRDRVDYLVGDAPRRVLSGDFDGDGTPDLVSMNVSSDSVTMLLGGGDGTFRLLRDAYCGVAPTAMAADDLDGDGKLDLLVLHTYCIVTFLRGLGGGILAEPASILTGSEQTKSMALADFNGDSRTDLAVALDGGDLVRILLGSGDGTFVAGSTFRAGDRPHYLTAGDLNRDGAMDLVVANDFEDLSVVLGDGRGGFSRPLVIDTVEGPSPAAIADLDGDDIPDLAAADGGWNGVRLFHGNGDGTFSPGPVLAAGRAPPRIQAADLNFDGSVDLAFPAASGDAIWLFHGEGGGAFRAAREYATGEDCGALAMADFDGDGIGDVAASTVRSQGITVFRGKDDGTFELQGALAEGYPFEGIFDMLARDLDGDGTVDLAAASAAGKVVVLLGDSDGGFGAPAAYNTGPASNGLACADFDEDGSPDLAVANVGTGEAGTGSISVLLSMGDGTFRSGGRCLQGTQPFYIASGDYDGDKHLDLAAPDRDEACVHVVPGRGDGSFGTALKIAIPFNALFIASADFDRDGRDDLSCGGWGVGVLLARAPPTPWEFRVLGPGPWRNHVPTGDINGDGLLDFVAGTDSRDTIVLFLGLGDGTFELRAHAGPVASWFLAMGDLDADGLADLAAPIGDAGFAIFRSRRIPPSEEDCNTNGIPDACDIASGSDPDEDGDGVPDECEVSFRRGDANADSLMNIADPVFILRYLFLAAAEPPCRDACDLDDSGTLEITDAIYALRFQFSDGPAPPEPFPGCGIDLVVDGLDCASYPACP